MSLLSILKAFFIKQPIPSVVNLGALPDTRPQEEKEKDPIFSELVAKAATVNWIKKDPSTFRIFGSQNQAFSSSCVAQAMRKALRVLFKVNHDLDIDLSGTDIYRRRPNFPDEGMSGPAAFTIVQSGVQLNALMPSDNKTEYEMNHPTILPGTAEVAAAFKVPNSVTLSLGDIETVASVIQETGKGVILFYFFTQLEWSQYKPTVQGSHYAAEPGILRHAVCAVDFTLNDQGEKCLVVDDSAHFGGLDRRLITQAFHSARNYYAAYPMRFSFDPASETVKPTYKEGSITSLQDCLKAEGVFPSNVASTGVYGPVTTQAVKDFQKKYGLDQVGTVGPQTTAKLKTLYP